MLGLLYVFGLYMRESRKQIAHILYLFSKFYHDIPLREETIKTVTFEMFACK